MEQITKQEYNKKKDSTPVYYQSFKPEIDVIDSGWTKDTLLILNDGDLKVCRVVELIIDASANKTKAWHLMYVNDSGGVEDCYTTTSPLFYKDVQDAQKGIMYDGKKTVRIDDYLAPCIDAKYVEEYGGTVEKAKKQAKENNWCQYTKDDKTMTYWTWDGLNPVQGSVLMRPALVYNGETFTFGNSSWGIEGTNTWDTKESCMESNKDNIEIDGIVGGEISKETKDALFPDK